MTLTLLNRQQARKLDQIAIEEYGIPGIVLMENAGRNMADFILSHRIQKKITICCGKGNNGGDGFVIARHLDNHHIPVEILLFADANDITGDAKTNYHIAMRSGIPIIQVNNINFDRVINDMLLNATCIVDALFGTGLKGELTEPFIQIIQVMNASSASILSVDIPSGLDCDTGKPHGIAVQATYTLTCVCLKAGFIFPDAKPYLGEVHVIDIGIPKALMKKDKL